MNTQKLLEDFQNELVRRGLPVDYAQGAAEELADHHRDLTEELQATGKEETIAAAEAAGRLGDRQLLVKKSVREFQRRHWCGRWPLLTFLFGPVALLLATWVSTFLLLMLVGYASEAIGMSGRIIDGQLSTAELIVMSCFLAWFAFLVPAAVILFLARKANHAGLGTGWVLLAGAVLALTVGTMQIGYSSYLENVTNAATGEPLAPDRFVVSVPSWVFIASFEEAWTFMTRGPQQLCQFFLPLGVAGLVFCRKHQLLQRFNRTSMVQC